MKERDDKQWCALIGWIRFLCFDLLPPHYSGGSDRCVSVEVFVAFLNNVNKFLGCYKGGEIFSLSMCVLFIINIPPCGCCRCRCIFILLVFILKASSLFFFLLLQMISLSYLFCLSSLVRSQLHRPLIHTHTDTLFVAFTGDCWSSWCKGRLSTIRPQEERQEQSLKRPHNQAKHAQTSS